jgi:hypothetical protein
MDHSAADEGPLPEQDAPTPAGGSAARTTAVGTLVTLYGFFDALVVGLPLLFLAAWLNPLVVFVVAAVVLVPVNGWLCTWLDREWDGWFAGAGQRVERKLDKMRKSAVMRHPVAWIQRGSDGWFALAAALTNAIVATAFVRLLTGQPVGARRIRLAALAYGIFFAALFSLLGFVLGDVIRAL